MHVGTRSTLAGMAFVSAGAIALAPVAPIPDVELVLPGNVSAAVQLTTNPLEYYTQVAETIIGSAATLIGDEVANPAPILRALFNNQGVAARELLAVLGNLPTALLSPEFQVQNQLLINSVESFFQSLINNASVNLPLALEGAFDYLAAGDVESALNTILNLGNTLFGAAILGPFAAVQGYLNFLVDTPGGSPQLTGIINAMIGNDQFQLVQTFLGAVGPVISGIGSVGTAIQNVLDAVVAGDVLGVVTALINAPATVIDGVLNGGYGPSVPFLGYYPGILTANAPFLNGPLAVLQSLGQAIAQALGAPPVASMAATAIPADDAELVALEVGPVSGALESVPDASPVPAPVPTWESQPAAVVETAMDEVPVETPDPMEPAVTAESADASESVTEAVVSKAPKGAEAKDRKRGSKADRAAVGTATNESSSDTESSDSDDAGESASESNDAEGAEAGAA